MFRLKKEYKDLSYSVSLHLPAEPAGGYSNLKSLFLYLISQSGVLYAMIKRVYNFTY